MSAGRQPPPSGRPPSDDATPPTPPPAARALLLAALPAARRDEIASDLDEMYRRRAERDGPARARWWYRGQALSFAVRFPVERLRDATAGLAVMSAIEWRLGLRMLRRYPGLSLIGGAALAGAIGVGALVFEFATETLWPRIPLPDGERIVRVELRDPAAADGGRPTTGDVRLWRDRLGQVVELGAARTFDRNVGAPGVALRPVHVAEISPTAFPLTRVPPLMGRPLIPADEVAGAQDVVVLGHDVWSGVFGADPDIVGQRVQVGGVEAEVVGVMPEGFGFPRAAGAWLPLRLGAELPGEGPAVQVFGRLAEGATTQTAQAEVEALVRSLPGAGGPDQAPRAFVAGLAERPGGLPIQMIVANIGIVFLMLGVCANVATLMFARVAMRESEIVVRTALGARRRRIMGQLFVEAMVLASCAAGLGLLAAQGAFWFMDQLATKAGDPPRPFWQDTTLEATTVLYAFGLAVVGAALVSVLPGLKATGPAIRDRLARVGAAGSDGEMKFGGVWSVIIIAQVALTVIALPIAIGATSETIRDLRIRSAFAGGPFVTFRAEVDRTAGALGPADGARAEAIHRTLEERLAAEPGVTGVAYGSALPGTAHPMRIMEMAGPGGEPERVRANRDGWVHETHVGPDFFDVFDKPIVRGRGLGPGDVGARTVVVNESLAQNLGGEALGARVRYAGQNGAEPGPWLEVVGVVRNFDMEPTDRGEADFAFEAAPPGVAGGQIVVVRVGDEAAAAALTPRIRSLAAAVDPALRVYETRTYAEVIEDRARQLKTFAGIALSIVSLALLLSAAGLFALMAVAVDRRTREIGIRVALGADRSRVLRDVFARAAFQLVTGIVVGNGVILGLMWALSGQIDIAEVARPLASVSVLMVLVGVGASAVPARRALAIQPTNALKETG